MQDVSCARGLFNRRFARGAEQGGGVPPGSDVVCAAGALGRVARAQWHRTVAVARQSDPGIDCGTAELGSRGDRGPDQQEAA